MLRPAHRRLGGRSARAPRRGIGSSSGGRSARDAARPARRSRRRRVGHRDGPAVVAVATHDTASAVAAIPLRDAAFAFISAGTWSLVGVEVERPLINDATFAANLTNEGGVGGTFRLLRNVTGLWLLHECRRVWAEAGDAHSFDELVALAEDAPALQSFIEPNDPAFAPPGDMPARVRAFCAHTGQTEPVDPARSCAASSRVSR